MNNLTLNTRRFILLLLVLSSVTNMASADSYTYKVINLRHTLATHYTVTDATAGTAPSLPNIIRSPLLADGDYKYYEESSVTVSGSTYTVNDGATPISVLPASGATIYVTYTYTKTGETKLDLSGATKYYIKAVNPLAYNQDQKQQREHYLVNEHKDLFNGLDGTIYYSPQWWPEKFMDSNNGATKQGYKWYLEGNDPYDIYLKSVYPAQNGTQGYVGGKSQTITALDFFDKGVSTEANTYSFFLNADGDFLVANDKNTNNSLWRFGKKSTSHGSRIGKWNETGDSFQAFYNFTFIEVPEFWFIVKTHVTGTTLKAIKEDAVTLSASLQLPDKLKRKYCNYEFYTDESFSDESKVTTYQEAVDNIGSTSDDYKIYVKYTVDESAMPFELGTSFDDAAWYRLYENNTGKFIYSNGGKLQKGNVDTYTNLYMFAFVGDPYELRIYNMERTATRYLMVGNQTNENNYNNNTPSFGTSVKGYWELYDDGFVDEGDNKYFALRLFGTNIAYPLTSDDNQLQISRTKSVAKFSVAEGKKFNYKFIILDKQGRVAMQYTTELAMSLSLNYNRIPEAIRSEYIQDETLSFWSAVNKSAAATADGRYKYTGKTRTSVAPTPANLNTTDIIPIYVTYTTNHLAEKHLHLRGVRAFGMELGQWAYAEDNTTELKKSSSYVDNNKFWWHVIGGDPYAVQVQNVGATANEYLNISVDTSTTPPTVTQSMGTNTNQTSFLVLMKSSQAEDADQTITMGVLPIGGEDVSYDDNAKYLQTTNINLVSRKKNVTYYLIDRSHKLLLKSGPVASDEPIIPDDIRSPFLADNQYHYYNAVSGNDGSYTPSGAELTSATDATSSVIYVFYDACTELSMYAGSQDDERTNIQMYLLKYDGGETYYQENGSDGFNDVATKAVYPYNNGDHNLYVYGQEHFDKQMGQGASTRSRWGWFIQSANNDPYHVKIQSNQNQGTTNSVRHRAYLRSYTPAGYDKIVTGAITDNPRATATSKSDWNTTKYGTAPDIDYSGGSADNVPTEYMLLGASDNACKLVTTYILNGSGTNQDTYGAAETDYNITNHYTVHSFEQYWKNNPTIINLIYEYNGATTDAEKTTIQTRLNASGLSTAEKNMLRKNGFHSYNAWANAAPWPGGTKAITYAEHWFYTIEMGETFSFVPFDILPAIILLDQHGWEIARMSVPAYAYASGSKTPASVTNRNKAFEEFAKYNSPMVKAYHWWASGSKAPGYHKYTVSTPEITIYSRNGSSYTDTGRRSTEFMTTTSITDYPYDHLAGLGYGYDENSTDADKNKLDLYVTYEVKDEYKSSYVGSDNEEYVSASEFLIRQGANYAVATSDALTTSTTPGDKLAAGQIDQITDDMKWYLKPNFNIDREMGYHYEGETGAQESALSQAETETENYTSRDVDVTDLVNGRNGFDPYNLQIQNKQYSSYLTTSLTSTVVNTAGGFTGSYDSGNTLTLTNGSDIVNAVGHDQVTLNITNTVFMAVQDANGNMRLMPRFDHGHVLEGFGIDSSVEPPAAAENATVTPADTQEANDAYSDTPHDQTTLLQIPKKFTYVIVDNQKREALRFESFDGELKPTMKPRFTSPFAKDFKFYSQATIEGSTYTLAATDTIATTSRLTGNEPAIYVRYGYDYKADNMAVLSGGHFKITINGSEVGLDGGLIKSSASEEYKWFSSAKATINPDPYAMQIFNQDDTYSNPISITVDETIYDRFIVLPFTDSSTEEYGLATPTSGTIAYQFVDGSDLTVGATVSQEANYATDTYKTARETKYKVEFDPDVPDNITYKIITSTGHVALTGTVAKVVLDGNYVASLPAWMATPIMKSSAYRYYAKATTAGGITTVDPDYETKSVLNLADKTTVYVRYDYNADTRQAVYTGRDGCNGPYILDLSGKQSYLLSNYEMFWRDDKIGTDGTIAITDASANKENTTPGGENILTPLSTRPLWLMEGNDPYEITLRNKHYSPDTKKLYAKMPTASDKDAKNNTYCLPLKLLDADAASSAGYTYSTFMLLPCNFYLNNTNDKHADVGLPSLIVTGQEQLAVSRPDGSSDKIYVYKRSDTQETRATSTTYGNPEGHMRFEFVPIVEYHIITNEGNEALTVWSNFRRSSFDTSGSSYGNGRHIVTSDNTVTLPKFAQSPLLNESDFRYFTTMPAWDGETLTEEVTATVDGETVVTNAIESGAAFDDLLSIDSYTGGDIYVRYTYDRATSPLKVGTLDAYLNDDDSANDGIDLNGDTWYNLANMFRGKNNDVNNTGGFLYSKDNDNFGFTGTLGVGTKSGFTTLSAKNLLWRLEGNDPYAIRIHNSLKGNDILTIPTSGNAEWKAATAATNPYKTFMYMNAFANDERNGQAAGYPYWHMLMATGSDSETQYSPMTAIGDNGGNNNFAGGIVATTFKEVRNDVLFADGNRGNYYVTFFRANVTRRYRFHAMNCAAGSPVEAWTATIEHEWLKPVVLEDAISRRYAWYETKSSSYSDKAGEEVTQTIVTPTNVFDTRENLENVAQFYHNMAMTERIYYKDNTTTWYDYYPEIEEDAVYDIYFKYKPMTNEQIASNYTSDPFRFATTAQVSADVETYAEKGRLEENTIQTPWFFMVLDTDDEMTVTGDVGSRTFTGRQYFLRREDSGGVSWMNNSFALHNSTVDNYNNWSCHRLAEWYKKGDNEAYREGRWLWTFIGNDPYNLRLLNMESAVGVKGNAQGVYNLDAADNCFTTITSVTDTKTSKTTYPVKIPTAEPNASTDYFTWGVTNGYGSERTLRLVNSQITTTTGGATSNNMLYWQMGTDSVECNTFVSANRTQSIQLIPYVPVKYQDINLVIKRDEHVKDYVDNYRSSLSTMDAKRARLQSYPSGLSLLYFTADERSYCAGDEIDMSSDDALPLNVRRAFCDYTLYSDDYSTTGGTYTVTDGPYPDKSVQATTTGTWTDGGSDADDIYEPGSGSPIVDEDGRPVYPYYTIDANGHKCGADGGAQSLYVKYKVTSDIFLKTMPTQTEVATMTANNDHVYFMDFPDTDSRGNDNTHHAFYDDEASFSIQTGDLSKKIDKNTGTWRTEKKKANGTNTFVDDSANPYNKCQFRTDDDRMTSVPENLKWYFVGDPYKVQVYNTAGEWNTATLKDNNGADISGKEAGKVAANLARFNPVETNFQFVVDCVHMQMPDYSNIDSRPELFPTDSLGKALDPIPNRNQGKPYFNDFYWEVVPTTSTDPDAFALRFKEDNDLMGYRNVYYYLAHEGLTKRYRQDNGEHVVYHINLNYSPSNDRHESGQYLGYHKANDKNTVIRLVQPVKVYITATKGGTPVVTDELSEYYGLDEMLDGVPRHLQRRYVSYDAMQHELTIANATSKEECLPASPSHPGFFEKRDPTTNATVKTYKNVVFKYNVGYTVNDVTASGVHLFTPAANPSSPTAAELASAQWLDMTIGDNNWPYYDKTNTDAGVENQTTLVSNYRRAMSNTKTGWNNDANGWTDGLKGLHWAFIGDPYDFTILNRRRYEDNSAGDRWLTVTKTTIRNYANTADSIIWTTSLANATTATKESKTTAAAATDAHFSIQMWKKGGEDDFFLRTASMKTYAAGDDDSETNNYWRMVQKNYLTSTPDSYFEMVPYSLQDKSRLTDNMSNLTYNSYVNNYWGYSSTMSSLGPMQQRLIIRTAVAKDNDRADNDSFDADIDIVTSTGVLRITKTNMEVKYGTAKDMLPYSLRRYGCTYDCYLDYVDADHPGTKVESFDTNDFRALIASLKAAGERVKLTYVYRVEDSTAQFFTSASDALTEDYTWMNTYFAWNQTYSGTNVEVEYYEREFDHYVYNAQGQVIDEVYRLVRKTRVVSNPNQAYPTTAYLNSHTAQTNIYADEGTQSENDRQKWTLVGDPYEFTMKNYAQYLVNANAVVTRNGSTIGSSNTPSDAQQFALTVDKNGKAYLTIIDSSHEATTSVTFDFSTSSEKNLKTKGTGTNLHDPTGNTLDVNDVKPFMLANLIRYADILQYHLVIAHQHSLDHNDELSDDNAKILKDHLLEFLMYQGIRKNEPGMYVNGDVSDYLVAQEDNIKTLLKQNGTLRDFISYPISDYSVSRVGIGNHPQVPWYMKRQFCRYFLYQKDVLRSVTDTTSPALEEADESWKDVTAEIGGIRYKVDPSNQYRVSVYEGTDGKIYLWKEGLPAGTKKYENVVQRTFVENGVTKRAYNVTWKSIFDKSSWSEWTDDGGTEGTDYETIDDTKYKRPSGYAQALAQQGKVLDKLQDCHFNRMVKIDVVYEVIPEEFQFATRGRNTTAWYQMMTNNDADGLMNFTYLHGIGARKDRTEHYTNNYLWAPEGDPYGFVLRSRYATINGNGWDNVAVTTKGHLPKESDHESYSESTVLGDNAEAYLANYTSQTQFDDQRIIHKLKGEGEDGATSDGPSNAVYEMFTGDSGSGNSFLMHPTSAFIDTTDPEFSSYYMVHNTATNTSELLKQSARSLQTNADANWHLSVNVDMLWPYFEHAGYVGGLDPAKAQDFTNQDYYNLLKTAKEGGTQLDFSTMRKIQELVFAGTFKDNTGTTVAETERRPLADRLPMTFESTNLVNMKPGYYRIKAFSQKPLDIDGNDMKGDKSNDTKGVTGPRYISGYRFESEKTDPNDANNDGGRWLHFFETDMKNSDIHTYADLKAKITAAGSGAADRDWFDHKAMRGYIEILPADFDPSSIFYFTEVPRDEENKDDQDQKYARYNVSTQGLRLYARPGGTEGLTEAHLFGRTELCDPAVGPVAAEQPERFSNRFRLADIGGAAVTLNTIKTLVGAKTWDEVVTDNLKTNYVCIDRHHRYRITCHTDNEMVEIGDHTDERGTYGIQDTKWRLQPVGIREQWPYNEMPLRVEVQKGGVDKGGNEDNHYYGSLYVPFDTRLGNPADAAFTLTTPTITDATTSVTMSSVSQLNEMGNPQFVPANWPVVVRTTNDKNVVTLENQDGSTYATRHYVNMYIPNATPTTIPNTIDGGSPAIKLKGQLLEQELPADAAHTIMVFGLPFKTSGDDAHDNTHHKYDTDKQVGWYTNDNWARETDAAYTATARTATHAQRSNKYVFHNKVYYVLDKAYEAPSSRYVIAIFDDDTDDEEQRPIDITDKADTPWPCDVYDTAGRRVAENETPSTLLKNHPALRRGVYIFGGRKVVVK